MTTHFIIPLLYSLIEVLTVLLPVLLSVAYVTVIERKVIGSIQRRIGPNSVGYYGILQPFADALKLLVKEIIIPSRSNVVLFIMSPIISMIFAVLGWAVVPFSPGLALLEWPIGILYSLAITSLGVYGLLFAGWSSNTKWAFLGSLRATALMISYELIYSSVVLSVLIIASTYNITYIILSQISTWYVLPLLPMMMIFVIAATAELGRTPFDNSEAESELVSGFITEHSSVIFVFFFLAEYCSLVLISTFISIIYIGGTTMFTSITTYSTTMNAIILGTKSVLFMYMFVWIRATLPRLRYDQLIVVCWSKLLPMIFAQLCIVISIIIAWDITLLYYCIYYTTSPIVNV